jgi:hypothetical protein
MNTPDVSRAQFKKSSYSGGNGGCVSVAPVYMVPADEYSTEEEQQPQKD